MAKAKTTRLATWHRFRGALSAGVLIMAGVVAGAGAYFYLTNSEIPDGVVNGGAVRGLLGRYGINYRIDSLRLGRGPTIEVTGVNAAVGEALVLFDAGLNRLAWEQGVLTVMGIDARTPLAGPNRSVRAAAFRAENGVIDADDIQVTGQDGAGAIQIGSVRVSPAPGAILIAGLRFVPGAGGTTGLTADQITISTPRTDPATGALGVDEIAVGGVGLSAALDDSPPAFCEALPSVFPAIDQARAISGAATTEVGGIIRRLQQDAGRSVPWSIGIVFMVGLLVLGAVPNRAARAGVAALSAGIPFVASLVSTSAGGLLSASLAVAAVVAAGFWWLVYRHAPYWYQRWEPVAVALVGALAISTAILGDRAADSLGLELPSGIEIGTLAFEGGNAGRFAAMTCGRRTDIAVGGFRGRLDDIALPLADFLDGRPSLRVAAFDLGGGEDGVGASIEVANAEGGTLLTVSDLAVHIDNVVAALNMDTSEVETIAADFTLAGAVESPVVRDGLERFPVLRDSAGLFSSTRFSFVGAIRGPATEPALLAQVPEPDAASGAEVRVRASVALDLDSCQVPIDAAVDIDALAVSARLERRGNAIRILDARITEGAALSLGSGEASVSIGNAVEVEALLRQVGLAMGMSALSAERSTINASIPAGCTPSGTGTARVAFDGVQVSVVDRYRIGADRANFALDRDTTEPYRLEAQADVDGVTVVGSPDPGSDPWLEGDVSHVRAGFTGRTSPEFPPRDIEGELDFEVSGPDLESGGADPIILGIDPPVRIRARTGNPAVDVPEQRVVVHQSVDGRIPADLPIDLSFSAAFPGPEDAPEVQGEVRSDWIRLPSMPRIPTRFQLDAIPTASVSTSGSVVDLPLGELVWSGDLPFCRRSLRTNLNPFRIEGVLPGSNGSPTIRIVGDAARTVGQSEEPGDPGEIGEIQVLLGSGGVVVTIGNSGLGLRGALNHEIRRVRAPGGRIETLDTHLGIDDLRPLEGDDPPLSLATDVRTSDQRTSLVSIIRAAERTLIDAEFERTADRVAVRLRDTMPLRDLWDGIRPFLDPLDCPFFQWIDPELGVDGHVVAELDEGGGIDAVEAGLEVRPGSRLRVDFDAAGSAAAAFRAGYLRTLRVSVDAESPIRIDAALRESDDGDQGWPVRGDLGIPITIEADGADGTVQVARIDLDAGVAGSLTASEPDPGAVLGRARELLGRLGYHRESALRVFRGDNADPVRVDAEWNLALGGPGDRQAFQFVGPTRELHGTIADFRGEASLRTSGMTTPFRLASSGDLTWAVRTHERDLVFELRPSPDTGFTPVGQPGCRLRFQSPVTLAIGDQVEVNPALGSLWDSALYTRFWSGYTPAYPDSAAPHLVDCSRIGLGPASLMHFGLRRLAPITIGLGDRIQVHAPFDLDALYGRAGGVVQADLAWTGDRLTASVGGAISMEGFQAGAIGLASGSRHIPVVEDELSANVDFLAREVRFGPGGLARSTRIPSVDLNLAVRRTNPGAAPPGWVQASTELGTRLMNELLERIVSSVRFSDPPRALTYDDFALELGVEDGVIRTDRPLLQLDNVRLRPTGDVDVQAEVNVHWQRPGWRLPEYRLESLLLSLERMFAPLMPEPRPGPE